jgi:NAD(P)H-flavin reductase
VFELMRFDDQPLGHTPGQFIEVSVLGVGEAPISVCSSPTEGKSFRICVRAVGGLTRTLHNLKEGACLGIRGPFGRGFQMERFTGMNVLFVAGGIGMAPLRSAIRYTLDHRDRYGSVTILYGAKTPDELLFKGDLRSWSLRYDVDIRMTVDRGDDSWVGRTGVITTLFPALEIDPERTVAVVVGPPVMYRFVLLELMNKRIPESQIVFSLERRMKCGVGKCGHCQINGTYVCQEGPVFEYPRLRTLWEAVERVGPVDIRK